jgi:Protein of unknown function (DUF1553)/Protein of unknown function (DUF1549)/Planctomycete cytochrome C
MRATIVLCLALSLVGTQRNSFAEDELRFSRDILPLLSDKCLACHGPDDQHRKADLRLDTREDATAHAIVPGDPQKSELMRRILSKDPDEVMPPPSHNKKLTPDEIAKFSRWIETGAAWGKHWFFEKPLKTPITSSDHPVDALVQARLSKQELTLAPEAAKHTLLRRVSFDLTGLPPTLEQLALDASYEAYVDGLLDSPHFGERMAMWWLDAARYSDTDGFQADAERNNWPWRDWVIDAFNSNMRFDQFTLEQFAGDLLPDATPEQQLATCFHRNHMTNGEGGRDPDESRVDYVLDRVNTMGTTYLGLTLNCTQCHSHKFDPISQNEYYGLTAFFNSIDEDGKAGKGAKPYFSYESKYVQRAIDEAQQLVDQRKPREVKARDDAGQPFEAWLAERTTSARSGHSSWHPLLGALESSEGTDLTQESDATVQASGPHPNQDDYRLIAPVELPRVTGLRIEILPHPSHTKGAFGRGQSGEFILTDVKVQVRSSSSSQVRDIAVSGAVADYVPEATKNKARSYGDIKGVLDDDPRNGWTTQGAPTIEPHIAVLALAEPLLLEEDEKLVVELRQRSTDGDANIGRFRLAITEERGPAIASVGPTPLEQLAESGEIDKPLRERLLDQFLADYEPYQVAKRSLDRATAQLKEATSAKKVDVMVLAEKPEPRETFVLERGVWDKHGEKVQRGGLSSISPLQGESLTRVDLARWLSSPDNPLTARVIVNHLWQLCFGAGLVRTNDDFGLQGEQPTHPELLDWLAVEFIESGWDVKHLLKLIVTSKTYRQSSRVDEKLLARDPDNRLLARGSRFRLPAWMLRDAALQASGLINSSLGGPPVKPYQPAGVWEENFMGRFTYVPSDGAAQYRRTLYAYWRRSIAPTFLFDSAQRRTCEVRTSRTNTPLQALTLLNDENYLEASRALATLALTKPQPLHEMTLRILSRSPTEVELAILERERDRALAHFRSQPRDAVAFLSRGQTQLEDDLSAPELASYTVLASLLFNLDEAISHE